MNKFKPVLKYNGGQFRNAKNILPLIDDIEHETYVEHCAGAIGLLLNKKPSRYEVINDIDESIYIFFSVLQNPVLFSDLIYKLENTPYSIQIMKESHFRLQKNNLSRTEQAYHFFVKCWMTRTFNKTVKNPGWLQVVNNIGGGHEPVKNFRKAVENLYLVRDRILQCSIDNRDIRKTLLYYDKPTTLHYIDLPYLGITRSGKEYYDNEILTDREHSEILDIVLFLNGSVIISSYESDLYNSKLIDFEKKQFKAYSNGKKKKIETIYWRRNYGTRSYSNN